MRFWLTLILSTILLSAGLTVLSMYQGAQTVAWQDLAPVAPATGRPEMALELAPNQAQIANGVEVKMPPSKPGERHSLTIKGRNQGTSDLVLKLIKTRPEGEVEVRINGNTLSVEGVSIKPGSTVEIMLQWQVDKKYSLTQEKDGFKYRAEFDWNDHRYDEPLHIEGVQKIIE